MRGEEDVITLLNDGVPNMQRYFEIQIGQIDEIGFPNYLAQQIED